MTDNEQRDFRPLEESVESPSNIRGTNTRTETIDLESLPVEALTPSGSFDLRAFETTSLGKLLQAPPTPAFFVDRRLNIIFANHAGGNIDSKSKEVQGSPFPF